MTNTKRAGLRRDVIKILASVSRGVAAMRGAWTVRGTVYDSSIRDERGNALLRERAESEYPENDPVEWYKLCESLDDMINGLTIMRGMAWENYVKVREENDAAYHAKIKD